MKLSARLSEILESVRMLKVHQHMFLVNNKVT